MLAAGKRNLPESAKALADLCQIYWPAVYAFVRRQTPTIDEAQDLTQAFFTHLLEKDLLAIAQPGAGPISLVSADSGGEFTSATTETGASRSSAAAARRFFRSISRSKIQSSTSNPRIP